MILARSVGRPDEDIAFTTLGEADPAVIGMQHMVIIGNSSTRVLHRPGKPPLAWTPRFVLPA